ncbi:tyrosine-type recombinase/integrase [Seleniivibrio woodruffii]|uniref:Site-specific recombinase XerD n=1 Tax=Seleniivibrio woodruffii TaxID=1078050 RepID=A0A4R1K5P8_9BACT|nr:site-specific integrase [Seleniivibrio woodruffii]TCK58369.1 site-specific recombinase XerD [Seleniivibrio woodruffii]TVZ36743.1 site-specific recombinase XerD [Seleniivibrio woodruffii]
MGVKFITTNYPGVVYYESAKKTHNSKPDRCYYFSEKRKTVDGKYKTFRTKIGWASEGVTIAYANEIRSANMKLRKHGITKDIGAFMTFREAAELYLRDFANGKSSIKADISRLSYRILPEFGDKILNEITAARVQQFYNKLLKSPTRNGKIMAPATAEHHIKIIRQIFNYLKYQHNFLKNNPADFHYLKLAKYDNTLIRYLNDKQTDALLNVLAEYKNKTIANMITLYLHTGMRKSVILNLTWSQIDTHLWTIQFTNKDSSLDTIVLNSAAQTVLAEQMANGSDSEFVFTSKNDKNWVNISKHWKKIKEMAGLTNFRLHDLRHNFATQLHFNQTEMRDIMALMTHKDAKTTLKYTHVNPARLREMSELIVKKRIDKQDKSN